MEAPLATVRPVFRRTAKSLSYPRLPELSLILSDAPFYGRTVLRSIMRLSICAQMSRSEEHTSELQSQSNLVCRLLLEKKTDETRPPWRRRHLGDDHHPRRRGHRPGHRHSRTAPGRPGPTQPDLDGVAGSLSPTPYRT